MINGPVPGEEEEEEEEDSFYFMVVRPVRWHMQTTTTRYMTAFLND